MIDIAALHQVIRRKRTTPAIGVSREWLVQVAAEIAAGRAAQAERETRAVAALRRIAA